MVRGLSSIVLAGAFVFAGSVFAAERAEQPKAAAKATKPAPRAARPARPVRPTWPDAQGLYNVAQTSVGATAKGSGAPFNKDWPALNAIQDESVTRGGALFGSPLKGGRCDIHLALPCDIKGVETIGLDYNGTQQPKAIDILVDGKLITHADLPETPGQAVRTPVEARGQVISIVVTDEYPRRDLGGGKLGPNYGGWQRLRVLATNDLVTMMKAPASYAVTPDADNVTPTIGALAEGNVKVFGEPRITKGHPNTIWDQQDIDHYKEMLKTSPMLQKQYEGLRKAMDQRLTQPLGIPEPQKDAEGKWMHLPDTKYGKIHNALGLDIANMATMYVLSGEEKYADFCKQLLLAYADAYPNYGIGARPGFMHDPSKVFDQRLSDATWLIQLARGYDLIYNFPGITPEQRKHIANDLINANARHIMANSSQLRGATNWSAIATCAVLIAGYATDDQELIDTAMWGIKGTKEKPTGGINLHFSDKCIDVDGMWSEGAMGYQFMAMEALVADAEILWHHGIDMYRYRDGALKRLFDSPLQFSYPDLTAPAIHDSGHGKITGRDSFLYEYAYRRYRDPKYLVILKQTGMNLDAQFQKFPVSVLYDRDPNEKTVATEWKSVNLFSVGYGIQRITTDSGTSSLLMDYGPNRSHGHPDKLNIDLYAFGDRLIPDPGSIWYEQPLYRGWYHTTMAHNTLCVDELEQQPCDAKQITYGTADTFNIQRAMTDQAYAGVTMDRSLFMTSQYVADIYGAFTQLPRKMDLCWHIRGQFATDLKLEEYKPTGPQELGYSELANQRQVSTDGAWSASFAGKQGTARFIAAGGTPTQLIFGDGHLGMERPTTILQRRTSGSTIYGNVIDISGAEKPYVQSATTEGGVDKGYSLMKVQTAAGTDLCFTSFRPGMQQLGDLETDAQQAFVVRDGNAVRAMYLAGGTRLKVGDVSLVRSEPGLAYIEKVETGAYVIGNPSPSAATVTIDMPAVAGFEAYGLNYDGQRTGAFKASANGKSITLSIEPVQRVELAPKGVPSRFDKRQEVLRQRQADVDAAIARVAAEAASRSAARANEAKSLPVPANTFIVLQAEDLSEQGGGTVKVADTKRAILGKCIFGWDGMGHWLQWSVEAPADGYYNLAVCYCAETGVPERQIQVNGQVQEPIAFVLPATGGWANGSDDWQLLTAPDPSTKKPLLIKLQKGANMIRLTNTSGDGVNLDYLVITSPDVVPTRGAAAAKLK